MSVLNKTIGRPRLHWARKLRAIGGALGRPEDLQGAVNSEELCYGIFGHRQPRKGWRRLEDWANFIIFSTRRPGPCRGRGVRVPFSRENSTQPQGPLAFYANVARRQVSTRGMYYTSVRRPTWAGALWGWRSMWAERAPAQILPASFHQAKNNHKIIFRGFR